MGIRIAIVACVLCAAIGWPGLASAFVDDEQLVEARLENEEAAVATTAPAPAWIGAGDGAEEFGDTYAAGMRSLAVGPGAWALGEGSTAFGIATEVDGLYGLAVGHGAWARIDPASAVVQTHQVAIGSHAIAWGDRVVALGGRATAWAGWNAETNTAGSAVVAVGTDASASGKYATAVGDSAWAMYGMGASAFGAHAKAIEANATAIGVLANAPKVGATALGAYASVASEEGTALGGFAYARGVGAVSIGGSAGVDLNGNGPLGRGETTYAFGDGANAIGSMASAIGAGSVALGHFALAEGEGAHASGRDAVALGEGAASVGHAAQAAGRGAAAFGSLSAADGEGAFAFGGGAFASSARASAIGFDSVALADDSVALGAGSIADQAMTVSIGTRGAERRMVHVADGVDDTDAANYGQVRRLAEQVQAVGDAGEFAVRFDDATRKSITLGSGTSLRGLAAGRLTADSADAVNGAQLFAMYDRMASVFGGDATVRRSAVDFIAPSYALDNGTFGDVGSALDALQAQSRVLRDRVVVLEGGPAPKAGNDYIDIDGANDGSDKATHNGASRSVAIGAGAHVAADATGSVAIGAGSVAARAGSVSVGAAGKERQVTNVARATEATDAVNMAQMQEADAEVYAQARSYVDLRVDQSLAAPMAAIGELRADVDARLGAQDLRIDRQSAMTSAAMNMAASAAGVRTPNRVAVGAGTAGGEQALAIGYQRAISDRAALTFGGAFSSGENSAGVGISFGW